MLRSDRGSAARQRVPRRLFQSRRHRLHGQFRPTGPFSNCRGPQIHKHNCMDRSPQGAAEFRGVRQLGPKPKIADGRSRMADRSSILDPQFSKVSVLLAWLVHLYTALGAVVAFVSILLIEQSRFQEAFLLMFLAVVIDATDGTLARAARVKEIIPWFDGDRLE